MKSNKLIMLLCTISITLVAGCSNDSNTQSANIVETVDKIEDTATASEEKDGTVDTEPVNSENKADNSIVDESKNVEEENFTDLSVNEVPQAEIDESKFNDELSGSVKEINSAEKFVIISKIYVENYDDGVQFAVQPAEGSGEEEIIKVYFTDEAKYLLETGKADGSNISSTESDFSEIIVGDDLDLKGVKDTTGTEFLASEINIIRVID